MRAAAALLALAALPAAAQEIAVAVPSGQAVTYLDTITDAQGPMGLTLRMRFVAPGIAGGAVPFETAAADMQALCDGFALARIPATGPQPAQIVIALMDRPVVFGEAAPEVVQFFEAYRIENGACVWEAF